MPRPLFRRLFFAALAALVFLRPSDGFCEDAVRISGAGTLALVVADAAQILRAERGIPIQISTAGGTGAGINALGEGTADIAMASRPVSVEERSDHPDVQFSEIYVGEQIVALAVAQDVWEAGVHVLTRAQARQIYEQKVTNWKEFGGPKEKIAFFNFEEGRGAWEIFAQWLYGDAKRAPLGRFPTIASNEEARNTLEFTPGSMTQISPSFVDEQRSHALAIRLDPNADTLKPTLENVAAKRYGLTRSMFLVVNDKPTLNIKIVVDFLLSERGGELMKKHGFYPAAAIEALRSTR